MQHNFTPACSVQEARLRVLVQPTADPGRPAPNGSCNGGISANNGNQPASSTAKYAAYSEAAAAGRRVITNKEYIDIGQHTAHTHTHTTDERAVLLYMPSPKSR